MHIEFKRIILHNFMSFGHADLHINDDGFIRVSGLNENPLDNAGSNGSGKSSLWEAVVWAITGETIRGTKQIVNLYGDDGCYVDIEFYIDQTRYQLIRSKDHKIRKTNLQILINGEDKSGKGIRDSEKLIQQYLPDITASLLGSVIILGQGLPQKFTNNTPSGRKEVLEKLSKSDFMIEDLKTRVSERKAVLQSELRQFENNIIECTSKQQFLQKQIEENNALLLMLNKDELENTLTLSKSNQYTLAEELDSLDAKIDKLNQEHTDVLTLSNETNSLENTKLNELQRKYNTDVQPYKDCLISLTGELNIYNKQLKDMQSVKDVCPTCGQKLPEVHKPDTTIVEQTIADINVKIHDNNIIVKQLEEEFLTAQKLIKEEYVAIKLENSTNLQTITNMLTQAKQQKTTVNTEHSKVSKTVSDLELKIAQLQATIDNCHKIIRDNNEYIVKLNDEFMYNNMQKDLTQSHLDVINKFDTALKRDFRGYLLSTVITYIETRAKYYSNIIFDTANISFCLNGNNIDISYMNKAYENLSGGEKQKIDLIIQFSIRDMLSQQLGFTSNVLVLDEVFDGLDSIGCKRVIDMIASVSDIKNTFIVTHRKDLSIPCDKEILIVKSSAGISEIR